MSNDLLFEGVPELVRHCVASYMDKNPGKPTNSAFAVCVSTMQKAGYVEPGTLKLTKVGSKREQEHESEPDAAAKKEKYHGFLKQAREEAQAFDLLDQVNLEMQLFLETQDTQMEVPQEIQRSMEAWGRKSARALWQTTLQHYDVTNPRSAWDNIKSFFTGLGRVGIAAMVGGFVGMAAPGAFAVPSLTFPAAAALHHVVKPSDRDRREAGADKLLDQLVATVDKLQEQATAEHNAIAEFYFSGLAEGLRALTGTTVKMENVVIDFNTETSTELSEGKVMNFATGILNVFQRWMKTHKTTKEMKVTFGKLYNSLNLANQSIVRLKQLAKEAGLELDVQVMSTPNGVEMRLQQGMTPAKPAKGELPPAPPVAEATEALEEAKRQHEGPGRPSLPIGAIRRWKKEGKTFAMVKVGEPSIWIHKKSTEAAKHHTSMARGAVRNWRRGTMIKLAPGRWVRKKGKFSHEALDFLPSLQLLGEKLESRAKLESKILAVLDGEALDLEMQTTPLEEGCGCGCSGKATSCEGKKSIRDRIKDKL